MTTQYLDPIYPNDSLKALVALMNSRRPPLALVGAGASRPSGYPDWPGLTKLLGERAQKAKVITPKWLATLADSSDPPWAAEEYRQLLTEAVFDRFIGDTFVKKDVEEPYHAIMDLPFRHILTTNYEHCCEAALERTDGPDPPVVVWDEADKLNRFLMTLSEPGARRHVVHLHGRYTSPQSVVLTESSYVGRYVKSEDARRKLLAIFMTNPVVFIGFSLDDPDLAQLMREVAARSGGANHFALMKYSSELEREAIASKIKTKFGVQTVFYYVPEDSSDHGNLVLLLRHLKSGGPLPDPVPVIAPPSPARQAGGKPPINELDPNKGQFGRRAERQGYRLSVTGVDEVRRRKWLTFRLVVEDTKEPSRLAGAVGFFLHPSFNKDRREVPVENGRASLKLTSYGAFTVGVRLPGGVELELDLATVEHRDIPMWFRLR